MARSKQPPIPKNRQSLLASIVSYKAYGQTSVEFKNDGDPSHYLYISGKNDPKKKARSPEHRTHAHMNFANPVTKDLIKRDQPYRTDGLPEYDSSVKPGGGYVDFIDKPYQNDKMQKIRLDQGKMPLTTYWSPEDLKKFADRHKKKFK